MPETPLTNIKTGERPIWKKIKESISGVGKGTVRAAKGIGSAGAWTGRKAKAVYAGGGAAIGWLAGRYNNAKESVTSRQVTTSMNAWLFIIAALAFHLTLASFAQTYGMSIWYKATFSGLFALCMWWFVLGGDYKNANTLRWFLIIVLGLDLALPLLSNFFLAHFPVARTFINDYLLNAWINWWWFYYGLFAVGRGSTKPLKILEIAVVVFWLGVMFYSFPAEISYLFEQSKATLAGPEQVAAAKDIWERSAGFWTDWTDRMGAGISKMWEERISMATGDYYAGRVEAGQNQLLGVDIEDVKPSDPEFEFNEKVSVYGYVRARTLDDGITIKTGCYEGVKDSVKPIVAGSTKPKDEFIVFDLDEEDIDCAFDPAVPSQRFDKSGTHKVTLSASFNFETMAYLKTYFIDNKRLRAMRIDNIDPLKQFGIYDENPIAVFTNGPVKLGIGTKKPPIGVDDSEVVRVGVTVDNNIGWRGKIKRIKQVVIEVPDSMEVIDETCSHRFGKYGDARNLGKCTTDYIELYSKPFRACVEEIMPEKDIYDKAELDSLKTDAAIKDCVEKVCKQELDGYNAYYLDAETDPASAKSLSDVKDYKTFSCQFKVTDKGRLLGIAPITTRYIRARVRYDYEIEEFTSVKIKAPAFETGGKMISSVEAATATLKDVAQQNKEAISENSNGFDKCLIYGIIMDFSQGIATKSVGEMGGFGALAPFGGRHGLMGINEYLGEDSAENLGLGDFDDIKYDTAKNIQLGVNFLSTIKALPLIDIGGDENKLLVVYKETMESGKYKSTALLDSPIPACAGKKVYECSADLLGSIYQIYLGNVKKYIQFCKENDLFGIRESLAPEKNKNSFWSSSAEISVSSEADSIPDSLKDYKVDVAKMIVKGGPLSIVTLTFRKEGRTKKLLEKRFMFEKGKEIAADYAWFINPEYPFIRIKAKSADIDNGVYNFEVQHFVNSVVNFNAYQPPYLKIPDNIWTDSEGTPIVSAIFYPNIDSLNLFYHKAFYENKGAFCILNINKDTTCANTPMPEIRFTKISKENNILAAQLEYNPEPKS